ncbi:MAG: hypothetical protein IPM28_01900 [Chloracidobacterium sp.]|nr:hypothetical protein [Chloracidobacterium sp.]
MTVTSLRNKVAGTLPEPEIKLTILRDGTSQDLTATLDRFDTETSSVAPMQNNENNAPERSAPGGKLGLTLRPITPRIAKQFGSGTETEGLRPVVLGGRPERRCGRRWHQPGILLEVNRQPFTTPRRSVGVAESPAPSRVLLLVSRKDRRSSRPFSRVDREVQIHDRSLSRQIDGFFSFSPLVAKYPGYVEQGLYHRFGCVYADTRIYHLLFVELAAKYLVHRPRQLPVLILLMRSAGPFFG